MSKHEAYIELRLPLRGLPYCALLTAACPLYGFERAFDVFRVGAERQEDGSVVVIHHLPDEDNVYEIDQVKEGRRLRWYGATLKGDPVLHRIRKFGAKLVVQNRMSIQQVLETFPDRTVSSGEAISTGSSDDTLRFEDAADAAEEL
jgi:hypothetical protein